jgi:hypothetical protein
MPKLYRGNSYGPVTIGTISTAGWTSTWSELPYPYKYHALACKLSGSTAAITGTVTLQGRLGSTGYAFNLISWSSTLGGTGRAKDSTNSQIATHIRITSTGLSSTASTGTPTPAALGTYCGV